MFTKKIILRKYFSKKHGSKVSRRQQLTVSKRIYLHRLKAKSQSPTAIDFHPRMKVKCPQHDDHAIDGRPLSQLVLFEVFPVGNVRFGEYVVDYNYQIK